MKRKRNLVLIGLSLTACVALAGDVLKTELALSVSNNTALTSQITKTAGRGYVGYVLFSFSHTNINATALTVDIVKGSDTNRIITDTLVGTDDLFWAADGTKLWLDLTNSIRVGVTEAATNTCNVRVGILGPEER